MPSRLSVSLPALCAVLFVLASPLLAAGPPPGAGPLAEVPIFELPPFDNASLLAEDRLNEGPGIALRYAMPHRLFLTPEGSGQWEILPDGSHLWRLRVQSPGAVSLSFGFTRYAMPAGGSLTVESADGKRGIRAFTAADNKAHGELWTPILESDDVILQVHLPAGKLGRLDLELTTVGHGYRPFGQRLDKSGACNVDVICPEGDDWRDEIRSVAVIGTGASTFCTGFMVNNTAEDLTPYFMTADHCGIGSGNAASLVVYWNYENSTCRTPGGGPSGGSGDGTLDQFQTGSTFRAGYSPSDFTLVELDSMPDPAWDVHWAGWDANSGDYPGAVAIHHPNTDEKRISFEDDPTTTTSYLSATVPGNGTHIRVEDWDLGTTEGGSSGSPLFNLEKRVIGQLHGGFAACGNNSDDWYGRISVSWQGGGTAATRLVDWLDPTASGALTLDGRDLVEDPGFSLSADPTDLSICVGDTGMSTITVQSVNGFTDAVTLSASGVPAPATDSFGTNPVTPTGTSTLTIDNTGGVTSGTYAVTVDGVSGMLTDDVTIDLTVAQAAPGAPTLTSPSDGATSQSTTPSLQWMGNGDPGTFTIEVATDEAFSNVVDTASGLTGTSYTPSGLSTNTQYFWRVSSTNACGAGGTSAIFDFTTAAAPGDCSMGEEPMDLFFDDLEGADTGWTHSGTGDTWQLSEARAHSGAASYHGEDVDSVSDQTLVSPAIDLPAVSPIFLKFWNHQTIEDSAGGCFDGGVLEISTNGGVDWTRLEAELLTDPYDGLLSDQHGNPLAGDNAWCGDPQDWLESVVSLDAFAGETVRLRFRLVTDESVSREGWYVDDVRVQTCGSVTDIFADGFESGDVSSWSTSVP